jgi:LPS-assembly lipoprotein
MRKYLLFILFLSLVSCGFHMRGKLPLAPPLQNLYLKTNDPYGELARYLREYLKVAGVHLTEQKTDASSVLVILNESTAQQLLGISGTQQTRQYNLILTVVFSVETPEGVVIVPPQSVSQVRTLTIQADQILAGSNEANILYKQMRSAIGYTILLRLASKDVTTLLMTPPS